MAKIDFSKMQEIVTSEDVFFLYDNDYWEIRRYARGTKLTKEMDENNIIVHSNDVDFETFPDGTYDPNCYGNGLLVLLAHTPNHRVKGINVV